MSDSEALTDQSHVESSNKRYNKRRSSIFQVTRRLEDLQITKDDNDDDSAEKPENPIDDEPFDLPAYIERLRNERKAWKETLNARKSRRRNLQKEKFNVERKGADYDLSVLTESERSFVQSRPSYHDIAKNINNLSVEAIKVGTLCLEIKTMKDRLTLNLEQKLVDAKKRVIKMSYEET